MFQIFGHKISDLHIDELMSLIDAALVNKRSLHIVTANPEILLAAKFNQEYNNYLLGADLLTADGVGVIYAGLVSGYKFKNDRLTGVSICKRLFDEDTRNIYIIGSTTANIQKATHNSSKVTSYTSHGILDNGFTLNNLINDIKAKYPDVILIALGHIKQEKMISTLKSHGISAVFIGIGGSIDYLSSNIKIPNILTRKLGFEWLYRLYIEPTKRYKRIFKAVVLFPIVYLFSCFIELFHVEHSNIDKSH